MGFFSNILEKLGIGSKDANLTPSSHLGDKPDCGSDCTDAAQAGRGRRCRRAAGAARGS